MNCIDGLKLMKPKSVNTCVSSPPYYALRDYGIEPTSFPSVEYSLFGFKIKIKAQAVCLGLEKTPQEFIGHMVYIYRLVRETLTDDGTCWVNIGDSYSATGKKRTSEQACRKSNLKGSKNGQIACKDQPSKIFYGIKPKDMLGIPWMLAFALREDGWYLRQDIIWHKTNCMPESCNDRCTKNHEYIFLLSKSNRYYFDQYAIASPIADSTKNDSRVKNDEYSDIRVERGFVGNQSGGTGMLKPKYKKPKGWADGADHSCVGWATEQGQGAISKSQSFKREHHKHTEPIYGQSSVQHRLDRKESEPTGFANKRSVWTVGTFGFKEAHFATFPPKLIIDCIKAGASEYGCCPICGKGYRRVIATELVPGAKASYNSAYDQRDEKSDGNDQGSNRMRDGHKPGWHKEVIGEEWVPSCKHLITRVKKSVVLDMFMGSGTTAIVASKLGRDFIGFEQNEKYLKIAERRMAKELGLFNPEPIAADGFKNGISENMVNQVIERLC